MGLWDTILGWVGNADKENTPGKNEGKAARTESVDVSSQSRRPREKKRPTKHLAASLNKPSCSFSERKSIIESLCETGDVSCLAILLEQPLKLDRAGYHWAVKLIAEKFGGRATDALIDFMASKRTVPFQTTMDILREIGDKDAYLTALIRLDPQSFREGEVDFYWHSRTSDALKEMGGDAIEPLIRCLSDDDGRVRFVAARHLAECGDERALGPMQKLQKDKKSNRRHDVSRYLAKLEERLATRKPADERTSVAQTPVTYFEVEVPDQTIFYCSDNDCSCGTPGAEIQRGQGYLYISEEVVEARRDALTIAQLNEKLQRLQETTGAHIFLDQGTIWPILMCEQAARRRGLDLTIAASDAKQLFETGSVPLRVTPKA